MRFMVLLVSLITATGCSANGFSADRWRDVADIFTLTTGPAIGSGARVGPLHAGFGIIMDFYGLRGGGFGTMPWDPYWCGTIEGTILSHDTLYFEGDSKLIREGDLRYKNYHNQGYPLISYVDIDDNEHYKKSREHMPSILPYYTQLEVFGGALWGLRIGFNPGELVDFILGWFGLDIFKDDLGEQKDGLYKAEVRRYE